MLGTNKIMLLTLTEKKPWQNVVLWTVQQMYLSDNHMENI